MCIAAGCPLVSTTFVKFQICAPSSSPDPNLICMTEAHINGAQYCTKVFEAIPQPIPLSSDAWCADLWDQPPKASQQPQLPQTPIFDPMRKLIDVKLPIPVHMLKKPVLAARDASAMQVQSLVPSDDSGEEEHGNHGEHDKESYGTPKKRVFGRRHGSQASSAGDATVVMGMKGRVFLVLSLVMAVVASAS